MYPTLFVEDPKRPSREYYNGLGTPRSTRIEYSHKVKISTDPSGMGRRDNQTGRRDVYEWYM